MSSSPWPPLPLAEWKDTRDTLHMWTQVVGKICLALAPPANHFWNVALRVTPNGLATPTLFWRGRAFDMRFDFFAEQLLVNCEDGTTSSIALRPRSVADFYRKTLSVLDALGIQVHIWPMPVEVPDPIRLDRDEQHAAYNADAARRFYRILLDAVSVLDVFRCGFVGKVSPAHFFWGSFDLAMTRFSGRRAPERPGADRITREAYSHEVISHGFWTGGGGFDDAAFYGYAAPEPAGFDAAPGLPDGAFYHHGLSEYIFPYDVMRATERPDEALMQFLRATYQHGATAGRWDRASLEREATAAGTSAAPAVRE